MTFIPSPLCYDKVEFCDETGRQRSTRDFWTPKRKLSKEQVLEIGRRYAAGERNKDLALEYKVSATTISIVAKEYAP